MSDTNTTTAKHTPGPWELRTFDHGIDLLMASAIEDDAFYEPQHKITLVDSLYPEDGDQYKEAVANARLIAAAPKMFAACNAAAQIIEQLIPEQSARGVADVVLLRLRAALAEATATENPQ